MAKVVALAKKILGCANFRRNFRILAPRAPPPRQWRPRLDAAMAPAGKKTCTVLLVDVSAPSMTPHLGWIGDALSRVVQNRMMHAKADEFALVTCGARETKNDVHTEGLENAAMANEHDYEEEYLNISVDVPMACAS